MILLLRASQWLNITRNIQEFEFGNDYNWAIFNHCGVKCLEKWESMRLTIVKLLLLDVLESDYGSMATPFIVLLCRSCDQIGPKLWLLWPEKCHVDFCGQPFASPRHTAATTPDSSPSSFASTTLFGQCDSLYGQVWKRIRTCLSTYPHLIANSGCSCALELTKVRLYFP